MNSTTTTAPNEASVAELFDRLADAWNRNDGQAFAEPFAADADFVEIRGGLHRGRAAIAAGHDDLFRSIYAGSTNRYEVEVVRPVAPGVVVAIVGATMVAPVGPLAGSNRSRFTAVLADRDPGWEILSFHNTLVVGDPA